MSEVAERRLAALACTPAASSRARVRAVALLLPALALLFGGAASALEARVALLTFVAVLGWTQLVGL